MFTTDNTTHLTALETFQRHFIAAGLLLSEEELGADGDSDDISKGSLERISDECIDFLTKALERNLLTSLDLYDKEKMARAGTDFWLNRNGHGTGFWDREEVYNFSTGFSDNPGEYGENQAEGLSELCKEFKEVDFVRGDDDQIYLEG